jgi:rhamnogalacturonyl hydrolase YesR
MGRQRAMTQSRKIRNGFKNWIPSSVRRSYLAVEDAVRLRLYQPCHLKFWLHDFGVQSSVNREGLPSRAVYQQAMVDWLKRGQDEARGGGVPAYYALEGGWSAAYPETTGYIIVTCLEAAERLGDPELKTRARRMADWEVEVQLPEGAWQGGFVTAPRVPSVFNTGQIIQGMVAAYAAFDDPKYLRSASKAGRWLVDQQDADGAWRQFTYNNFSNSYSTRVAWPLLALADAANEPSFREAALRYLQWVSRCQDESGWFHQCALEVNTPPLTHTLGYTAEGLIESGILLNDERWIVMGRRTADVLLRRFEVRGRLAGTFDQGWRGDNSFSCVTGCAQMSLVWGRLFEITGDARYLNAALKLNDYVLSLIDLQSSCPGIRGGVKGSDPLWGSYMTYRMPSWAVKFSLDALFQEADGLARLTGDVA